MVLGSLTTVVGVHFESRSPAVTRAPIEITKNDHSLSKKLNAKNASSSISTCLPTTSMFSLKSFI